MHIDSFAESVSNIGEAFDSFNERMEDFEKIYVKMLTNVSNRKLKTTLCTIYNPCFEHNDMERLTYMLPPNPNIKKLQKRSVTALPIFNNIIFQEAPQVAGFLVIGMMGRFLVMDYLWEQRKDLIDQLQKDSKLFHSPIHGFKHWRTVERNGLYLSQFNDGDPAVISHFAYFHDCMRINEHIDDGHGLRGGQYALKNKDILDLTDDQLHTLYRACAGHTGGRNPSCDTIACCWDADRLDIRRVGIKPDLQWFNTDTAIEMVTNKDYSPIDN